MDISKSPVVGLNVNLDAAIKKLDDAISEIEEDCKTATAAAIEAIDIDLSDHILHANKVIQLQAENSPGAVNGYNYLLFLRRMFSGNEVEICCPDTGFHVWAETYEKAVALWERLLLQPALKDCCNDQTTNRTVYTGGGFPLNYCTECGRRHAPLP